MANQVDPFVIQLTPGWHQDPDLLHYLNRFLHDLWVRTGGGRDLVEGATDETESNSNQLSYLSARINALEKKIKDLEMETATSNFVPKETDLDMQPSIDISGIISRIKDLEAQL